MIIKFEMWSPFHYFMISFSVVLSVILYYIVKNKPDKSKKDLGIILSVIMIAILVMRNVYIWVNQGALNPEVIPLQVCHFANFMFLLAVISKNKVWGTIAWCLNFPAGLVSVIFADGLLNYPTMINIQAFAYISGHMLIVTTGLYMLFVGIININWQSMKKMFLFISVSYFLSILINSWFNNLFSHTNKTANYFYTFKPESGTPLEAFYNLGENITVLNITLNPIYLLLLGIVGFIVLMAMYGMYKLKDIRNIYSKRTQSVNGNVS